MLGDEVRVALGMALERARQERHEFITLEHLLLGLLHDPEASEILAACGANLKKLEAEVDAVLDGFDSVPPGMEYEPTQTMGFRRVLQRAIMHVQNSGKTPVTGGNILVAMYGEPESDAVYLLEQQGVGRLDVVSYISHGTRKDGKAREVSTPRGTGPDAEDPDEGLSGDALADFCTNLYERAEKGKIDPLIGRELEIERMIHILARRRKNNPMVIGDPGVGKTAIVEGLAKRIFEGGVPEFLEGVKIYSLDLGSLMAGTRYRGDFEDRLKGVINELVDDDKAILFIDEIHMLVGAGATSGGTMDASNLLKPALSTGDMRVIGSTTHEDYRQSFGKDKALARRFQTIDVLEPTVDETVQILQGLADRYARHHELTYAPEAIEACAKLSAKHITGRHLPDKAIDILDEVGAAARLKGKERVEVEDVEETVAKIARIPPKAVSTEDRDRLKNLEEDLKRVIYGQSEAIDAVTTAIKMSRAGLGPPDKPVGSFLFAGPTGVGKTELARQLSQALGVDFIRFDMSEYMERHSVSRLIGAPPGYVGHDQGGQLTDAVHKTPHCVLVMDEIEKAHPSIFNILLQIMDHGTLTDNTGRKTDFRNVILIMTSNAGAREAAKGGLGFVEVAGAGRAEAELKRIFPPEFRNRLDAIAWFNKLPEVVIQRIVDKFLLEVEGQLTERNVTIEATEAARAFFAKEGYKPEFGAREMGRVIQKHVKKPLADLILFGELRNGGIAVVDYVDGEITITGRPAGPPRPGPERDGILNATGEKLSEIDGEDGADGEDGEKKDEQAAD